MTPDNQDSLRLYERLYVSALDLARARYYAKFLLKKGWHSNPWERRGSLYLQQSAFTTALIVSYGRPFTNSNGWPKFPPSLLKLSDTQLALHFKLIKLRHQVYAHSDSVSFEIKPVYNFEGAHFDVVGEPFRKLESDECEEVAVITTKVIENIGQKLASLRPSVSRTI